MILQKIKFINNKYIIFLSLIVVVFLAIDLRFYKLSKTFTQYDDVWIHSLHKSAIMDRDVNFNLGPIKKKYSIPIEKIKELEHSFFLFPLYISFSSAYPPGQYLLLPLIFDKNDTFSEIIFKTRSTSAVSSVISILLLIYLFYRIEKKISWASVFAISIFSFSTNSILFSHHGSVYSSSCMATVCSIWILYLLNKKEISIFNANIFNTLLLYFSYLGILFFIPILFLGLKEKKISILIKEYFTNKFGYMILNIVLILPFFLRFFIHEYPHQYIRGPSSDNFIELTNHFNLALKSLISGFIPYNFDFYYLFFILIFVILIINFLIKSKNSEKRILFYCSLIYLSQWLILHSFNIIPLDQTRHSLIFFPIILTIYFIILSEVRIVNFFLFALILILIPLSYIDTKKVINKKISLFDYNYLKNREETNILLYDSLASMTYFENSNKKVYYISINQFRKNYSKLEIPENFLVVGAHEPFNLWAESYFKKSLPKLYYDYNIKTLIEIESVENYTYNNYRSNMTWPNGFYVYKFSKKK